MKILTVGKLPQPPARRKPATSRGYSVVAIPPIDEAKVGKILRPLVGDRKHWLLVQVGPDEPPRSVLLRFGRAADGRIVVTGMVIAAEEREISARSLRQIPLAHILSFARSEQPRLLRWWLEQGLATRSERVLRAGQPGPKGHPRAFFEQIAGHYRRALEEAPTTPVKWLAQQVRTPEGEPTPESTVRRWLQRSRDMGLLGPSMPGKSGEAPAPIKGKGRRKGR
jgi:hypothetical protein